MVGVVERDEYGALHGDGGEQVVDRRDRITWWGNYPLVEAIDGLGEARVHPRRASMSLQCDREVAEAGARDAAG